MISARSRHLLSNCPLLQLDLHQLSSNLKNKFRNIKKPSILLSQSSGSFLLTSELSISWVQSILCSLAQAAAPSLPIKQISKSLSILHSPPLSRVQYSELREKWRYMETRQDTTRPIQGKLCNI